MDHTLPERPNLEQLKKQARELLTAWHDGRETHRLNSHPNPPTPKKTKLSDASLVLAREYGLGSWEQLKRHVELTLIGSAAERFIKIACSANAGVNGPKLLREAERERETSAEITQSNLAAACAYGNVSAVQRLLQNASQPIAPNDWPPILYTCFSAYTHPDSGRRQELGQTLRFLLEKGANPNASFFTKSDNPAWAEEETAMYGTAGVWNNPELTATLIEFGGEPNDGEVSYHSPEHRGISALKVCWPLLTPEHQATAMLRLTDWHSYDDLKWCLENGGDPNTTTIWGDQVLHHSIRRMNAFAFQELLVGHGADVNGQTKDGESVISIAARFGRSDVIELITRHGAVSDLDEAGKLMVALASGNRPEVEAILTASPNLVSSMSEQQLLALNAAAGMGSQEALTLMLDVGFPVGIQDAYGVTPLHNAASMTRLPIVQVLLDRGASTNAINSKGQTPRQLAEEFAENGWYEGPDRKEILRLLEESESK